MNNQVVTTGHRPHYPMTPERRDLFLSALKTTGNFTEASRLTSPGSSERWGARSTFMDLRKRDPVFAAEIEEALAEFQADLESEARRRIFDGVPEPVFYKGVQAVDSEGRPAFIARKSDNILLRMMERFDQAWVQKKQLEHSGSVAQGSPDVVSLTVQDVLSLDEVDQRDLTRVLARMAANRGEPMEGVAVDVTPVVDADYEDVPDDLREIL